MTTEGPTRHRARLVRGDAEPRFPFATTFLGDYSNIAATPDGGVVAYWTDMREDSDLRGCDTQGEDAYFARIGP